MKALDIINRLKQVMPRYTSLFCDELSITSLSYLAGTVTCVCSEKHGLEVGDEIFINGALTPITISSITRVGDLATAVTASNHDLTRGYQETVTITGADQAAYNGEHDLIDVLNRRTFVFDVTGSPATPATGTMKTIEDIAAGYNGLHVVTNYVDDYTFTYATTSAPESPALGTTIKLRKNLSITGDVTMERFLESYSGEPDSRFWLVVIMGGSSGSKDRFTMSDAINTSTAAQVEARVRVIDPFSIFVVAPTSDYLTAMTTRDGMGYIFNALNKGILFYTFPTDTASDTSLSVSFARHDMYLYDIARYIHRFDYEFVYDLIREDGASDYNNVAFRDIDLHFNSYLNSKHNELMHTLVDLDDQPLP
jgi:hypothetical protein